MWNDDARAKSAPEQKLAGVPGGTSYRSVLGDIEYAVWRSFGDVHAKSR